MKQSFILFSVLLSLFFCSWGIKYRMPVNRPDNLQEEIVTPWYESRYSSPVAEEEWYLDPDIPDNYIPVPDHDEVYMVIDDSGQIVQYRKRTLQEDGTWIWEDTIPDLPKGYEAVSDNLFKLTDENGNESYYLYVRNDDQTFAFVPADKDGNPYYDGENAEVISSNYVHDSGNVYSVYNDNGVKEGYVKRIKEGNGYVWKKTDKPKKKEQTTTELAASEAVPEIRVIEGKENNTGEKVENGDGTYTVTEKSSNTITKDGYNIVYETVVYECYNIDGKLISTKKDGPYEVSRTKAGADETPNKALIETTLDSEYKRVSALVNYNTDKANEVLAVLNAERAEQGLNTLIMDVNSEAYKLACIRAGDMAQFHYQAAESPLYGSLDDMVNRWDCETSNASENIWKAGKIKTSKEINNRLQAYDGSRANRMSDDYSEIGIAVVEKDNELYYAEIFLK